MLEHYCAYYCHLIVCFQQKQKQKSVKGNKKIKRENEETKKLLCEVAGNGKFP